MLKKIATGALAVAATTALALSLPLAAHASSPDYDDYSQHWGPVYSKHGLAKAHGKVSVNWDHDGESNEVHVWGKLYDRDNRSYDEGGKCAFVKFETMDSDYDWSPAYYKKYCGFPGYKPFHFQEHDVYGLRAKVCQIDPHGNYPKKCGHWQHLYTVESE